jgi:hypothetical protein
MWLWPVYFATALLLAVAAKYVALHLQSKHTQPPPSDVTFAHPCLNEPVRDCKTWIVSSGTSAMLTV